LLFKGKLLTHGKEHVMRSRKTLRATFFTTLRLVGRVGMKAMTYLCREAKWGGFGALFSL
jgi:hypothetical protein